MARNITENMWWQVVLFLLGLVGSVGAGLLHSKVINIENKAEILNLNTKAAIIAEVKNLHIETINSLNSVNNKVDNVDKQVAINSTILTSIEQRVKRIEK